MNHAAPPIAKLASSLMRDIELVAARLPRAHRYTLGAEMRQQIREVSRLINRAWRDRSRAPHWVAQLVWAVDELKLSLQLGKEVNAYSFRQFEQLARNVASLGQQAGGWKKQLHPNGQNPTADMPAERAETLSTRAASICEAKS